MADVTGISGKYTLPANGFTAPAGKQFKAWSVGGVEKVVGDKITVRLTVKADRDMDFVQIKDDRAACMEPLQAVSGFRWSNGLGYYQATKDASTQFFIDQMRKGTYVIEYQVYVNRTGEYQAGIATVQSAYAPEFGGHTGGYRVMVE